MGIVNAVGSTIARETDFGMYLHAGPEIGVASTKAFTSQIVALALFTLYMGRRRHLSVLQGREIVQALQKLPDQVERGARAERRDPGARARSTRTRATSSISDAATSSRWRSKAR